MKQIELKEFPQEVLDAFEVLGRFAQNGREAGIWVEAYLDGKHNHSSALSHIREGGYRIAAALAGTKAADTDHSIEDIMAVVQKRVTLGHPLISIVGTNSKLEAALLSPEALCKALDAVAKHCGGAGYHIETDAIRAWSLATRAEVETWAIDTHQFLLGADILLPALPLAIRKQVLEVHNVHNVEYDQASPDELDQELELKFRASIRK